MIIKIKSKESKLNMNLTSTTLKGVQKVKERKIIIKNGDSSNDLSIFNLHLEIPSLESSFGPKWLRWISFLDVVKDGIDEDAIEVAKETLK